MELCSQYLISVGFGVKSLLHNFQFTLQTPVRFEDMQKEAIMLWRQPFCWMAQQSCQHSRNHLLRIRVVDMIATPRHKPHEGLRVQPFEG